jgi:hypothetical protein
MRFVKLWRYPLLVLFCISVAWAVTAYFRSPIYRASQAYARIHEGMTAQEADDILKQFGGEIVSIGFTGVQLEPYDLGGRWFGGRCYVNLKLTAKSVDNPTQYVTEKRLCRATFGQWLSDCLESIKSPQE